MTEYRRHYTPYAIYFFTVITYDRRKILTAKYARFCLRQAFEIVRQRWPFQVLALVLLPNHIHTLWQLPQDEKDYSTRWRLIKSNFTQLYCQNKANNQSLSLSRFKKNEQGIWQRRFWEHVIRDEKDFANHMDYIHYNPVKHEYVTSPKDWKWSTFHRYVKKGWYHPEWGASEPVKIKGMDVGE